MIITEVLSTITAEALEHRRSPERSAEGLKLIHTGSHNLMAINRSFREDCHVPLRDVLARHRYPMDQQFVDLRLFADLLGNMYFPMIYRQAVMETLRSAAARSLLCHVLRGRNAHVRSRKDRSAHHAQILAAVHRQREVACDAT